MKYPINEIFYSIQGEGRFFGQPSVFIRFAGCDLNCDFCDTDHSNYTDIDAEEICKAIKTLVENAELRDNLIKNGLSTMKMHTLERERDRIMNVINGLLESEGPKPSVCG